MIQKMISWLMKAFGMNKGQAARCARHIMKHTVKPHTRNVLGRIIKVKRYIRGG